MRHAAALAIILTSTALTSQPTAFRVQVAGHGRPMILIPGLSSSGDTWKGTVEHYKDRFTTHTVTLAGFAGVPAIEQRPLLAAVRDQLAAYIEANHLEKPIVVGTFWSLILQRPFGPTNYLLGKVLGQGVDIDFTNDRPWYFFSSWMRCLLRSLSVRMRASSTKATRSVISRCASMG